MRAIVDPWRRRFGVHLTPLVRRRVASARILRIAHIACEPTFTPLCQTPHRWHDQWHALRLSARAGSRWRLVTDTASDTSRALRPHSSPLMSCDVLLMSSRKPRPRRGRRVAPEAPPDLAARFDRVRSDSTKCDLGSSCLYSFFRPTDVHTRRAGIRPGTVGKVLSSTTQALRRRTRSFIWRRWRRPLLEL